MTCVRVSGGPFVQWPGSATLKLPVRPLTRVDADSISTDGKSHTGNGFTLSTVRSSAIEWGSGVTARLIIARLFGGPATANHTPSNAISTSTNVSVFFTPSSHARLMEDHPGCAEPVAQH